MGVRCSRLYPALLWMGRLQIGYVLINVNCCISTVSITEGLFITCTYEYVTDHWNPRSFMLFAFVFSYILPLAMVAFYYTSIVRAVFFNQAALQRAELKMMQDQNRRRDSIPGDIPNPPTPEKIVSFSSVLFNT